jgi:hypothetical protein
VDQLIGIGAGAAVLVSAAGYFTLRRPGVAVLAGIAGAATWVAFVFEWVLYDMRENGPVYTVTERGRTCSPRAVAGCPASGYW